MTFQSILFARTEDTRETPEVPDFFVDLHLDQIVEAITEGKQEYNLKPFFYTPLRDLDAINYRHEVMRDLENDTLFEHIQLFAKRMRAMRNYLAQAEKLHYHYQKERWFLDAVELYCNTVTNLLNDLSLADLHSRGFLAFHDYVADYAHSERFRQLVVETKQLIADLSAIKYCLRIKGNGITVRAYEGEIDYSANVAETFEKFRQGAVKDYNVKFPDWPEMNHVEAQILELVAKLNPDVFLHLNDYCAKNKQYLDKTLATFDREIQFYLAYLEYCARHKRAGLPFCYPRISTTCKEIYANEAFDVALASKLTRESSSVLCKARSVSWSSAAPTRAAKPPSPVPSDRCIIWGSWAVPSRAGKRSSFSATGSSRILKRKKTSPICAANCRMILSGFTPFLSRPHQTASSSSMKSSPPPPSTTRYS